MPIKRSKYQSDESLVDFYLRTNWNGAYREYADKMLEIVESIDAMFPQTPLQGITSHLRLGITHKTTTDTRWFVLIDYAFNDSYYIEYQLPEGKGPWKNAWMYGHAHSLEEAKRFLVLAMKHSGIWEANEELARLLIELNV